MIAYQSVSIFSVLMHTNSICHVCREGKGTGKYCMRWCLQNDIIVRIFQPHGNRQMEFADLNIGDIIGKGRFGAVFTGTWKPWNGEVAIKELFDSRLAELEVYYRSWTSECLYIPTLS